MFLYISRAPDAAEFILRLTLAAPEHRCARNFVRADNISSLQHLSPRSYSADRSAMMAKKRRRAPPGTRPKDDKTRGGTAMPKARPAYLVTMSAAAAVLTISALQPAEAQQRKSLRWTTSQVGSYGYTVAAAMAKIVEQALGGEYTVTVHPYTSPTVAMKEVMLGNGEIAYTADIGMTQFQERSGGFANFTPTKPELVHTWYAYPMESMLATTAQNADKFKCWKDFSGKPVFYTQAGFQNWLNWQRIFKVLGYEFKHVQIDLKSNGDALEQGTIVGSAAYTTAGKSLPA